MKYSENDASDLIFINFENVTLLKTKIATEKLCANINLLE